MWVIPYDRSPHTLRKKKGKKEANQQRRFTCNLKMINLDEIKIRKDKKEKK